MFIVALLGVTGAFGQCPKFVCNTIPNDDDGNAICARKYTTNEYYLRDTACPSGTYCTYEGLKDWMVDVGATGDYTCKSESQSQKQEYTEPTDPNYILCPTRLFNKTLESGSHPKKCPNPGSNNEECKLQDGTYADCECGLDGESYCVPDASSNYYSDYWSECSDDSYWKLKSYDHYLFWHLKQKYWPQYISSVSCGRTAIYEFKTIDEKDYIQNGAAELVLPLIGLFLF